MEPGWETDLVKVEPRQRTQNSYYLVSARQSIDDKWLPVDFFKDYSPANELGILLRDDATQRAHYIDMALD